MGNRKNFKTKFLAILASIGIATANTSGVNTDANELSKPKIEYELNKNSTDAKLTKTKEVKNAYKDIYKNKNIESTKSKNDILNTTYNSFFSSMDDDKSINYFKQFLVDENGLINTYAPQGICNTDDYILVSAYNTNASYRSKLTMYSIFESNNSKIANRLSYDDRSVIFAFDKKTKKLISTLSLYDNSHVGGITYADNKVFIGRGDYKKIGEINYDKLKIAIENNLQIVAYDNNYDCDITPSYVTYDDGLLWAGSWRGNIFAPNAEIKGYEITEDNILEEKKSYDIPSFSNGGCFVDYNGTKLLLLSLSYGKTNDSTLAVYEVGDSELNYRGNVKCPPMMETLAIEDSKLTTIFESGSPLYGSVTGSRSSFPLSGYVTLDLDKVIKESKKNSQDKSNLYFDSNYILLYDEHNKAHLNNVKRTNPDREGK